MQLISISVVRDDLHACISLDMTLTSPSSSRWDICPWHSIPFRTRRKVCTYPPSSPASPIPAVKIKRLSKSVVVTLWTS